MVNKVKIQLLAISIMISGNLLSACVPEPDTATTLPSGKCTVSPGMSDQLIIASSVLLPGKVIDRGAVLVLDDGRIGDIGELEAVIERHPEATRLDCGDDTVLSPGWVNVHEHEGFSYTFPDPVLAPVYSHREEWIFGRNGKPALPIPEDRSDYISNTENRAILSWVELRHLLSGTTTLGGPGALPGLTANIAMPPEQASGAGYDFIADLEIFPFSFESIRRFATYCSGESGLLPDIRPPRSVLAYAPHVGEGRRDDCTARSEVEAFIAYVANHRDHPRRYAAVHAVAASPDQLQRFRDLDVTLVWSPRSNLNLYGETADVAVATRHGVRIALSTDWSPSGSFNMLEELDCAASVLDAEGIPADSKDLWRMATVHAAYAVGLEGTLGEIRAGHRADLVLKRRHPGQEPYAAAIKNGLSDTLGVWVDGRLLVREQSALAGLPTSEPCVAQLPGNIAICTDAFDRAGLRWTDVSRITRNLVPIDGDTRRQAPCPVQPRPEVEN